MSSDWLDFVKMPKKSGRKTDEYAVVAKQSGDVLGKVRYHSPWRYYVFSPTTREETIHSDRCLADISRFVSGLNEERKRQKK